MWTKLAWRNVRRRIRDYGVYFITLTFGVCLFYVFNALDSQSVMTFLSNAGNRSAVTAIFEIIDVFSAFVTVVLAGLILYADRFLMKRRKRELGTYFLLGMPTSRIARLLAGEALLMGAGALVAGVLLGMVGSWALDSLTTAMFLTTPPGVFTFQLSWTAAGKTALYFGVVFLLVTLFTGVSVSRARLIDLIYAQRRNEEIAQRSLGASVLLFCLGLAALLAAYAILLIRGLLRIDPVWFLMLGLGTLGSFLLFRSLSGFLLRLTKGHPRYYRGLNMFVLRQWSGKIRTGCLSNTILSILLLLAMGVTACSVGLNDTITSSLGTVCPYDATLINYELDGPGGHVDPAARLRQAGFDPQADFTLIEDVIVYYNDEGVTGIIQPTIYAVLPLSTYNTLTEHRGSPTLTEAQVGRYLLDPPEPIVNGPASNNVAIVPDEVIGQLKPRRQMINLNYAGANKVAMDGALKTALAALPPEPELTGNYKLDNYYDLMGSKILVLYIGLYLGLVFLLTAAAILALQQLSEAADNAQRYELLAKLGASDRMRKKALFTQIGLAFALPLALGTVHAAVGMTAANRVIAELGKVDSVHSSLLTAGLLLLIYGGYFLATCAGAWRAVSKGEG